ncbi:outer membrane lipoprotein carrier protein LolA [Aeromonas sp.]|uniref:outer membrane lipoprotein carrier protein LolA n=1 Tax=Aeromonas sp. TaxID=647 RepID=UPI003FA52FA9
MKGMGGWLCARLLLLLPGMVLATPQAPAMTQAEVRELLSAEPAQRAHFEQEKQVAGLAQPLKASGELLLARGQGLWWHQLKPFELALSLTAQRMSQQVGQGPVQVIDNPQLLEFSSMMLALFGSDEQALARYFVLDFHSTEQGWSLVLTPLATPLNKVFASLTLSGGKQLERLVIADRQGDETRIHFSDWQRVTLPLSAEEQAHFAP